MIPELSPNRGASCRTKFWDGFARIMLPEQLYLDLSTHKTLVWHTGWFWAMFSDRKLSRQDAPPPNTILEISEQVSIHSDRVPPESVTLWRLSGSWDRQNRLLV